MSSNLLATQLRTELKAQDSVLDYVTDILEVDWLYPKQSQVMLDFYDSGNPYTECVLLIGMRSGKTTVASIMGTYEAYQLINMVKPITYYGLPKGSEIFIFNVAVSEQQAKDTVFAHIKARIDSSDWWQNQSMIEHHNEFIFPVADGRIVIRCGHSNSASLAGKTTKCGIIDEIARFKETGGKSSAEIVYETIRRSTRTFNKPNHPTDGHVISISSPMYQDDYQMQLYNWGKKSDLTYTMRCPTWEFNPNISFESLEEEFIRNPESAWRDYGAVPSAALELYIREPQKVRAAVIREYKDPFSREDGELVFEWKGRDGMYYYLGGDPAVRNDCFGLGLVHREGDIVINDWAFRFEPEKKSSDIREIDAKELREFIIQVSEVCNLEGAVFDTWQYPETIQQLRDKIGNVVQHTVDKATYDMLKEGMYTGRTRIADYEVLIEELTSLELIRGKRVDHPKRGSKDVSDAVANAVWMELDESGSGGELAFAGVNF